MTAVSYQATPGFFRALGTRLVAGRDFDEHDEAHTPAVAVVNETFARRLFPDENPVGKRFRFNPEAELIEIVGVVEAGKYQTLTEEPQLAVWRPLAQSYNSTSTLVARTSLSEREALDMLRRTVDSVAPDIVLFDAMSLEDYLELPATPLRLATVSLSAMGALAATLSALGLYALVAYATSRRTREVGIRMALGAGHREVLRALLSKAALIVAMSTVCGVVISVYVGRLLGRLLYTQPSISASLAAAMLLMVAATIAALLSTRRALRIEPLEALRYE